MKAKLITDGNKNYSLLDYNNELVATTMESELTNQKLSLKNCQAIELGYDLDELACNEIRIDISVVKDIDAKRKKNSSPCIPLNEGGCVGSNLYNQVKGFEKGFQKALELMGDKKFSEEDMFDAVMLGCSFEGLGIEGVETYNELKDLVIKRNTQTEWDVEVVIEVINNGKGEDGLLHETVEPKLDENGCLILKRI